MEGSWASLGLSRAPFGHLLGEILGSKMGHKREQKGTKQGHGVRRGLWTVLGTPLGQFWTSYGRLLGASGPLLVISRGLWGGILVVLGRIFGLPGPSPHFLSTFSLHPLKFLPDLSPRCPHFLPHPPHFFYTFSAPSFTFSQLSLTFFQLSPRFLSTSSPLSRHFFSKTIFYVLLYFHL